MQIAIWFLLFVFHLPIYWCWQIYLQNFPSHPHQTRQIIIDWFDLLLIDNQSSRFIDALTMLCSMYLLKISKMAILICYFYPFLSQFDILYDNYQTDWYKLSMDCSSNWVKNPNLLKFNKFDSFVYPYFIDRVPTQTAACWPHKSL